MTPSITNDQIMTALRTFLIAILPDGVEVVAGQVNRVSEPKASDFVVMTPSARRRLSTNVVTWSGAQPSMLDHAHAIACDVQLDIHGENGTDNATVITTLFRDDYGVAAIDNAIFAPLYASDGRQMPFVNGEQQYEDRWIVTVTLQAVPVISTPQQFAGSLSTNISAIGSAHS